ncbi:hypothetical protein DL95DRAFT_471612 [Leptodontidium sp. 2 PMI_412]|nr:hypothetical protein DL95DRAFT_471612 [Leptodontidium sp. 2 PMI_412]
MENANFWDDPNNYSLFMPDEGLDLFGDPNLGFDLDLFGDAGLDLALNNISLPVLDYSSTIQNGALMPSPALDLPSGSDISDPVASAHRDNVFQIPGSSDVQPQSSLWTQDTPKDSIPQSTISITDRDESPSSTTSDRESLKRRIAESVVVFSVTSDLEIKPRKRKAFSKLRKEEVSLNRLIGACIQCKIKKNACTFGLPCNQCIKRAGSAALGQVLCMRQSLLATRFDHIDLFTPWLQSVSKDVENSKTCPSSESSYLYFPGSNETPEAYIKVRLIDFEYFRHMSSRLIIVMDYFGASVSEVPGRQCAIYPRDLPSVGTLLRIHSVTKSDAHPTTGPFSGLQKAVRNFSSAYCGCPKDVPMRALLQKCLVIQQLFQMYRTMAFIKSSMQSSEKEMVSSTIFAQIRHLLVEELIPLEVQVFSALENLIYDKDGIGKENPLVTWACLWTLIFTYKEHMVFLKPLAELKLTREARYHLNQHIYNTLTSMYAALYKTTSPLTLDWRTAEISDMLGRDLELIRLFNDIKTEMYWFHAARDSLLEEDSLFKSLVVENESKLVLAHIKAAKKKGIL